MASFRYQVEEAASASPGLLTCIRLFILIWTFPGSAMCNRVQLPSHIPSALPRYGAENSWNLGLSALKICS